MEICPSWGPNKYQYDSHIDLNNFYFYYYSIFKFCSLTTALRYALSTWYNTIIRLHGVGVGIGRYAIRKED